MARQRSGRRTDYTWQGAQVGATLAAAGSTLAEIVTLNAPQTLTRIRGSLVASIDGPTDGDKVIMAFGFIVGTEEDLAIGVTAMPNPSDDLDAAWVWHSYIPMLAQAAGVENTVFGRLTVDGKAMRRMRQSETLILVVDNVSAAGTPATDFAGGFRCLFGS